MRLLNVRVFLGTYRSIIFQLIEMRLLNVTIQMIASMDYHIQECWPLLNGHDLGHWSMASKESKREVKYKFKCLHQNSRIVWMIIIASKLSWAHLADLGVVGLVPRPLSLRDEAEDDLLWLASRGESLYPSPVSSGKIKSSYWWNVDLHI